MRTRDLEGAAATIEVEEERDAFLADCLAGLSASPKTLPCKYFYDARGSELFERITTVPEYYPTRMETALLRAIMPAVAATIAPGTALVEFGSGASVKTRILLDAVPAIARYVPIDICVEELEQSSAALRAAYPGLTVQPFHADFTDPVDLGPALRKAPRLGFFPGSTIGNFEPREAVRFLANARSALGPGSRLLLGVDLKKDAATLVAAYDDAQGVTAAFNRNLLARMQRELDADLDISAFRHRAIWNESQSRIEMHLESVGAQVIHLDGRAFAFADGETIHTENCHKYSVEQVGRLANEAGWTVSEHWLSPAPQFALMMLVAPTA